MDAAAFAQYGIAGTTIAILLWIIKELWADNREIRAQMHADQAAMLPALAAAAAATQQALEESIRSRALAERERR